METTAALFGRRSVRNYTPQPITDSDLEEILRAGAMAPSGLDLQPWYFSALKSEDARSRFLQVMSGVCEQIIPELEERYARRPEVIRDTKRFLLSLGGAPVIILAFLLKDGYPNREAALLSTAAAIENILLAAYDRNLASCWLTAPVQAGFGPSIRDRFASGKGELVAVITLGYPEFWPKVPARREGRYAIV